mgnify:CR=1 FL=1|jgi:hypothetical protein
MNNLFLDRKELEKKAFRYLTEDHTNWVKEIITELLTNFPEFTDVDLGVEWIRKDFNKGTAVGFVNIQGMAQVPVIVDSYNMYDLDVIIVNNSTYPLTHDTVLKLFKNPAAFKTSGKGTSLIKDLDLFVRPVVEPATAGESSVKTAKYDSVIEKMGGSVLGNDLRDILSSIEPYLNEYMDNGHGDIIEKLSSIEPIEETDFAKDLMRTMPIDRQYKYEDSNGNTILKQANSRVNYTYMIEVDSQEADLNEDMTAESLKIAASYSSPDLYTYYIDKRGKAQKAYTTVFNNVNKKRDIKVIDRETFKTMRVSSGIRNPKRKAEYLKRRNKSTEKIASVNESPKVMKLVNDPGSLFLYKNGSYLCSDDTNSLDMEKVASLGSQQWTPEGTIPSMGDTGCWVFSDNSASKPFEVVGLHKVAGVGNFEVVGWDGMNRHTYYPLQGIKDNDLIEHDKYNDSSYVPGNTKFVKLATRIENNDLSLIREHISNKVSKDSAGLYSFHGAEFSKYSSKTRDLTFDEAMWTAIHCNVPNDQLESLESLEKSASLALDAKAPMSLLDLEYKIHSKYKDLYSDMKNDIMKVAAMGAVPSIGSPKTIDAVLGLSLLNKNNITSYLELIPAYEEVLQYLAKLLLAVRMGLKTLDEYQVKEAMLNLTKVVVGLKSLGAVMK